MKTSFVRSIEATVANTAVDSFFFSADNVIEKEAMIDAIESFKLSQVTKSIISKKALASDLVFADAYLVLVKTDGTEQATIPLQSLNRAANSGRLNEFDITNISITKSYIKMANIANLVLDTVFQIAVHYRKK